MSGNFTLTIANSQSTFGGYVTRAETGAPVAESLAPQSVARALRELADRLETLGDNSVYGGPIADSGGYTIGHYHGAGS